MVNVQHDSSPPHRFFLAFAAFLLAAIGVAFIFSAGYVGKDFPVRANWIRQIVFLCIGIICAGIMQFLDNRKSLFRYAIFGGYFISLALLCIVLAFGIEIGGARRWLSISGFALQPAEFAKLFTVLSGAYIFSGELHLPRSREFFAGCAAFLLPAVLIAAEPSYGNALSLMAPLVVLLATRFLPPWCCSLLLALFLLAAGAGSYGLNYCRNHPDVFADVKTEADSPLQSLFHGYHLQRFQSYLSSDGGWNEQQAILTIAGGGAFGKGYLNGTMNKLGYLPRTVAPTDFIFAVMAEEGGLVFGVVPVIALYILIYGLLLHQAAYAANRLDFNIIVSGTSLMMLHTAVGIGMNIRLLPVIGLPLPLLSYGGSFTVAMALLMGCMANAWHHSNQQIKKNACKPFSIRLGDIFKLSIHMKP